MCSAPDTYLADCIYCYLAFNRINQSFNGFWGIQDVAGRKRWICGLITLAPTDCGSTACIAAAKPNRRALFCCTHARNKENGMPNKVIQIQARYSMIIVSCGLNCNLCRAYIRDHHPCSGCRGCDSRKSNACLTNAIKNCE
jgi:hypothetical protein